MHTDASNTKALFAAFHLGVQRNSGGRGFWNHGEGPAQTPPPPVAQRAESSAASDDVSMGSPMVSTQLPCNAVAATEQGSTAGWPSRGSTPQSVVPLSAADGLKKSKKRRRDDDLDCTSIKRRAVSPGVSVHNSPILAQSPGAREWGYSRKASRENSVSGPAGERSNSCASLASTSTSLGPPKRVGLQGMTDANDSLMRMCIDEDGPRR